MARHITLQNCNTKEQDCSELWAKLNYCTLVGFDKEDGYEFVGTKDSWNKVSWAMDLVPDYRHPLAVDRDVELI